METIALGALGEKLLAEARAASSGRFAVTVHGDTSIRCGRRRYDAELVAGEYVVIPIEWDSFEALEDTVVLLTAAVQARQSDVRFRSQSMHGR